MYVESFLHRPLPTRCSTSRSLYPCQSLTQPTVEVVGYSARARSNADPDVMAPFLMQAILILLAPILFAASVYMFLGRIILATGCASYSLIRPTWLTRIFVGGDIFCFFVQLIGAAMLSSATTKSKLDLANTIVLVGLSAQIVIFGGFMVVGLVFHLRMRKNDPKAALDWNWERYMMSLYAVSVIITLRNLFRVIEYALGGKFSPLHPSFLPPQADEMGGVDTMVY